MKNMMKDAGILFVITLLAGLILGVVYQVTKEPIRIQEEKTATAAYAEVFTDAKNFTEDMQVVTEDAAFKAQWSELKLDGVEVQKVLSAKDESDNLLGYVLTVVSHEGYGGDIQITMGIRNDGTLNGIAILSISETAGLGMKAEDVLKPQFMNKNVASFTYTKTGSAMDSQIDAISGATITTNAVTNAVNGGLFYFQSQLGGGKSNE